MAPAASASTRKPPSSSGLKVSKLDTGNADDDVFGPLKDDQKVLMSFSEWRKVRINFLAHLNRDDSRISRWLGPLEQELD